MEEKVLMKGNEAIGESALIAGCRHFFGYPITPQNELGTYMSRRMPQVGGVFLQAESEIAAINMVLGASAAGVRVMTSSSSPGISLKTEGISYLAGSDLPCVIVNVQRGGPGLGGIQPSQADYFQATRAPGHGDLHIIVLTPSTIQEMSDMVIKAFDLADKYRMPAMILSDGILGQMMEPVAFKSDNAVPRVSKDWTVSGHKNIRRKNIITSLFMQPDKLEARILERQKRYDTIKSNESMAEKHLTDDAQIILVAYGAAARIVKTAVNMARKEGIKAGLIRPLTVWPFPEEAVKTSAATTAHFLCVEMSMGQMVDDVKLAINGAKPVHFFGRTGGVVPSPKEVLEKIKGIIGGKQ